MKESDEDYNERLVKFAEYKSKLEELVDTLDSKLTVNDETMNELKQKDLRTFLYKNGATINGIDYKIYKRSAAKLEAAKSL